MGRKRADLGDALHGAIRRGQQAEAPRLPGSGERLLPGARLVAIGRLRPNPAQPRKQFSQPALEGLAASIHEFGVLQPLRVRERGDGYEIVNGERRWRAAQLAGLNELPVVVANTDDDRLYFEALIENLQRTDLSLAEEANAYRHLEGQGYSFRQIAGRLGISDGRISRVMNLYRNDFLREQITSGAITKTEAQEVLPLPEPEQREVVTFLAARRREGVPVAAKDTRAAIDAVREQAALQAARAAVERTLADFPAASQDAPSLTTAAERSTPAPARTADSAVPAAARQEPTPRPRPVPELNLSARRLALRTLARDLRLLMERHAPPPQGALDELQELLPTLTAAKKWLLANNGGAE